jgi:hypothetical protein
MSGEVRIPTIGEAMKASDIQEGKHYRTSKGVVKVVQIRQRYKVVDGKKVKQTVYDCLNLTTGRKVLFTTAGSFLEKTRAPKAEGKKGRPLPNARPAGFAGLKSATGLSEGTAEGEQGSDSPSSVAGRGAHVMTATAVPPTSEAGNGESSLTQRLKAAVKGKTKPAREVGTPVAGMVPNEEQEAILGAAAQPGLKVLVVCAGAGSGKTATLKMLEQVLPGRGQYTAFNASLVAESKTKFVRCAVNTTYSLAFRAVGCKYKHRLGGERVKSWQMAATLGIHALQVEVSKGVSEVDDQGVSLEATPVFKTLRAEYLTGQVMVAIRRFCQSDDPEIGPQHFGYIDGIDLPEGGKRTYRNNDVVRAYLLPFARKVWADYSNPEGTLGGYQHAYYFKTWALGEGNDRPIIAADYILLDESQDSARVLLGVLKQQTHALLVAVGDDCQMIYEWLGCINVMKEFPDAPRLMLSQSYRFGQTIADVANSILATLDEPTDLVMRGCPDIPSRVDTVDSPRCCLYRTNAGAISKLMSSIEEGKRPHLIGGGADVVAWCQAAADLQAERKTGHPELACFDSWDEVVEYSKTDEGSDLQLMVRLVTEFGAEEIRDALKGMPDEEDADLVLSTSHKSKGRQWETVKLGPDFPTANKMDDAARRLLYVAATRAQYILDVSECPPFCGGYDKAWGEGGEEERWVPGLTVEYTVPMPDEDDLIEYLAKKGEVGSAEKLLRTDKTGQVLTEALGSGSSEDDEVELTPPQPRQALGGVFTWSKFNDGWYIRGPANAMLGSAVEVVRKNGTRSIQVIKSVVRQFSDAWIYGT